MQFDHIAEEQQEKNFIIWVQALLSKSPEHLAMQLAAKHRAGKPTAACKWSNGAFNLCYRVKYEDGFNVIVRFAALGRIIFRMEKINNEVTVMEYLARHTSIPVPQIFGSGTCWAGPYIVMSFIEGEQLSKILKDPAIEGRPCLNPRISDRSLKRAYREMAGLLVELSKPEFLRIGALEQKGEDFFVANRPLTFNMNELAVSANLSHQAFPSHPFKSAADYFVSLATLHLSHLRYQKNDAVTDEADCRKKYVARCLFREIARDISTKHRNGPFRLYCDDFRPSNVLLDLQTLAVSAVIDWEFAYVAPAEFTYVAPWWLLLQSPEDWDSDLNEFLVRYTPRLRLFLEALRECESAKELPETHRLSTPMEQSMENGLFWVCLAARYSSMFDEIYWTFIDQMYHGPFTSIEDRTGLLSQEEQSELNEFVAMKISQTEEGVLDHHYSIDNLMEL